MISQEEEKMIEAVGWTITCHSPFEMEHTDGSEARGYAACEPILKGAIEEYHQMKKEEAIEAEKSKKAEATKSLNLENINGAEILEFLNDQIDNSDDLCDISLGTPLEFEGQSVGDDRDGNAMYTLGFTAYFNNWGTDQEIEGNEIQITNDSVRVLVGEAFEGDGSDEELENVLREWLKTHKFASKDSVKETFHGIVTPTIECLIKVGFSDKEEMKEAIKQLEEAYTYMK